MLYLKDSRALVQFGPQMVQEIFQTHSMQECTMDKLCGGTRTPIVAHEIM
jgi:hypothetical protein